MVPKNHAFPTLGSLRLHKILTYLKPPYKNRGCLPTHKTIAPSIEVTYDADTSLIKELFNIY
jgi:hypothetical protein